METRFNEIIMTVYYEIMENGIQMQNVQLNV